MGTKVSEPNIFDYLSFRDYLRDLYAYRKAKYGRYTYEMFSSDCGFGKTPYIHLIASGTRRLTEKSARKMASHIPLRKERRRYFLALVDYENADQVTDLEASFTRLLQARAEGTGDARDIFEVKYFSEWYHSVIRELVTFDDFQPNPEWLCHKLDHRITPEQAAYSMELLNSIGYITFDFHHQKWVQTNRVVHVRGEVAELALTKFHQQMLELAKHSLFNHKPANREFAALTMTVEDKDFKQLKSDIREFVEALATKYGQVNQAKEVVQVNLQMFPITTITTQGEEK